MLSRNTVRAFVAAALFAPSLLAQNEGSTVPPADPAPLRVSASLFKSNADGSKFTPFRSGKLPFQVTVRLFDGPVGDALLDDDGLPWQETLVVTTKQNAPSAPEGGTLNEPTKVDGAMELVLGAQTPFPADLLERDAWFSTQVALLKDGAIKNEYAEAPRQPLGVAGSTRGLALHPDSLLAYEIEADKLQAHTLKLTNGAAEGRVLVSDSDGDAQWEEFPEMAGVNGTAGRIPLFDSTTSVGDSLLRQVGNSVIVDGDFAAPTLTTNSLATGSVQSTASITSSQNVVAGFDLIAGDDVIANDLVLGKTLVATQSLDVNNGALSFAGSDLAITGDLYADDVFIDAVVATSIVGADLAIGGGNFLVFPDGTLKSSGDASFGDVAANGNLSVDGDAQADGDIRAGAPSGFAINNGDVAADDDLLADDDLFVGDDASILGGFILSDQTTTTQMTLRAGADMRFVKDNDQGAGFTNDFQWWDGGTNAGLGADLQMQLKDGGNLTVDGSVTGGGADLAEFYPTTRFAALPPGTLVAIDPSRSAHVAPAELGVHEAVIGIVSTEPGVVLGNGEVEGHHGEYLLASLEAGERKEWELSQQLEDEWTQREAARDDRVAVALSGRVPLRVDASGGAIAAGDRLGLGATPGVAARWSGVGPVVAVALEPWTSGDRVLAFVHLDWSPDARWAPVTAGADGATAQELVEPAQSSGNAFFGAGYRELVIEAPGLDVDSRPLLTFFGDTGSRAWVSERGLGYFVVALAEPAQRGVELSWTLAP